MGSLAGLSRLESYGWFSAWISPECRSLYSLLSGFIFFGLNLTRMSFSLLFGFIFLAWIFESHQWRPWWLQIIEADLEFRSIYIFRPQYPHSSEGSKLTQSWLRNLPSKQIFLHKKLNNKIACIVSIPMVWIIDKMLSSKSWGNYFLDFSGDFLHGIASRSHFYFSDFISRKIGLFHHKIS